MAQQSDPVRVIEQFVAAYNRGDVEGVLAVCDEDIRVVHHNRGFSIAGRRAFADTLNAFKDLVPDKKFSARRAIFRDGDAVIVEHTWGGKATADIPGFGAKGETIALDLCTRYTVRDGLIVEYHDYG
ncbi:MAG: nuclear transport factor 2 family protein [Parvularculaceae bacterium]